MTIQEKEYQEIVLDLETWGTKSDAHIASIGAVKFNLNDQDSVGEIRTDPSRLFYGVADCSPLNGTVDGGTIGWWLQQSEEARSIFSNKVMGRESLHNLLLKLNTFVGESRINVWGNGATFDNVIIRSAYERMGLREAPWSFRRDMDMRTIVYLAFKKEPLMVDVGSLRSLGVHHNALDDSIIQTIMIQRCWRALNGELYGNERREQTSGT